MLSMSFFSQYTLSFSFVTRQIVPFIFLGLISNLSSPVILWQAHKTEQNGAKEETGLSVWYISPMLRSTEEKLDKNLGPRE